LAHIRREELLRPGDRVGVAVSGGIDSVALLRLLIELRHELGLVLSVVHFNHRLRGAESEADQDFVAGLARERGLEFHVASGDAALRAAEEHSGLEAAARELRYGFFGELLGSQDGEDSSTSGAKAQNLESAHRSAESAAPPKSIPQGLKPESSEQRNGTAEAVPFPGLAHAAGETMSRPGLPLNKIATGHTLDDQAETVLMRLIRGTGLRGLGGIHPRIVFEQAVERNVEHGQHHGEIIRPLLGIRRRELEQYLIEIKQPWREDSSNADSKFRRNRLRKLVLPLLEREFNPAVVESFAELATIARDEEDYWENEISGWLGTVVQWSEPAWTREVQGSGSPQGLVQIGLSDSPGTSEPEDAPGTAPAQVAETPCGSSDGANVHGVLRFAQDDRDLELDAPWLVMNASVSRPWLLTEPRAVQRRVLKSIGEQAGIPLEFKHIEEILRFAADEGPSGKELSLPLGWKILREPEAMVFLTPDLRRQQHIADYEYSLPVPGRTVVGELGGIIEALHIPPAAPSEQPAAEYNPQQLLRAELLQKNLIVRNWRAGDRFWPAHTKAPKKIKELLTERHVAQPERRLWPVVVSGDEIVWMRGFPVPSRLQAKPGQEAVLIREMPWAVEEPTI
jgi:tRNA(Ile)-lysidine synthetase-like protein